MSGHSKWSQIKHKKAITDARKGKLFSKLSAQISIAAKKGGDPTMNPTLRMMVEKARASGMTKDNIDRAIKRGTGELGGAALEQVRYEAYGPGGIAILIDAVTDNKNRMVNEVRSTLSRFGGKLADPGSVSYLFDEQGAITVKNDPAKKEDLALAAIDAGVLDYVDEGGTTTFYTQPQDLEKIKDALAQSSATIESAEFSMEPKQTINADESATKLLEAIDEMDDVTNIFTNLV